MAGSSRSTVQEVHQETGKAEAEGQWQKAASTQRHAHGHESGDVVGEVLSAQSWRTCIQRERDARRYGTSEVVVLLLAASADGKTEGMYLREQQFVKDDSTDPDCDGGLTNDAFTFAEGDGICTEDVRTSHEAVSPHRPVARRVSSHGDCFRCGSTRKLVDLEHKLDGLLSV